MEVKSLFCVTKQAFDRQAFRNSLQDPVRLEVAHQTHWHLNLQNILSLGRCSPRKKQDGSDTSCCLGYCVARSHLIVVFVLTV